MSKSIMILKQHYGEGPYLLHLRYWVDAKFKDNSILRVTLGENYPKIHKNYVPGDRQVMFAVCHKNQIPPFKVTYNDQTILINLDNYISYSGKQQGICLQKCKIYFTLNLLDSTDQISDRYGNDKISDDEKHRYNESINDLIRSQQEFLTFFERDKQVELVKMAQKLQRQRQMQITQQIMGIKPYNFCIKKCILIFIVFMMMGYLISERSVQKKNKKRQKRQKTKKHKIKHKK